MGELNAGHTLLLHPSAAIPLGPPQDEWGAPHLLPVSEVPEPHGCNRCVGQASASTCMGCNIHQDQQQHGPMTLQQAVADKIQTAAYDSGSSDNLAVVVLDIAPQPSAGSGAESCLCCKAGSVSDEANCATSTPECVAVQEGCTDSQGARDTAPEDEHTCPKQRSKIQHEPDKILGHALPAEMASGFQFEFAEAPEWPGVTLWRDVSQILQGSIIGRPDKPAAQYKLVQQMAELPRYADHVHTSWAGLPILSSMSLWLQPHLPRFATSPCPTSPHPYAEGGVCSDMLWGPWGLEASLPQGSSQVMLSPGTMLQLVTGAGAIPASCSWNAWDSSGRTLRPAGDCFKPLYDALNAQDNIEWLTTTSVALAQVTSSMSSEALTSQDQAFADNVIGQHPAGSVSTSNTSSVQRWPGITSDWQNDTDHKWQKYHRGRKFARGSFGEVWRAERASAGERLGTHGVGAVIQGHTCSITHWRAHASAWQCGLTVSAAPCIERHSAGSRSAG